VKNKPSGNNGTARSGKPDPDRKLGDRLYHAVGAAMHMAQALELNVIMLITIVNRYFGDNIDRTPYVVGNDKRTLGALIKAIQKHGTLNDAGVQALRKSLDSRNYIAHEFLIRHTSAFVDTDRCNEAVAVCKGHTDTIAAGTALTSRLVKAFYADLKLTGAEILVHQDI
jgi:hypothetical protein